MPTTDYAATIQRILDILQADPALAKTVKEWRFGELPEQTQAHRFPALYVTTSTNPQVSRTAYTVSKQNEDGTRTAPNYHVISEYWVVIVTAPNITPSKALKDVLSLQRMITQVINNNMTLRLDGHSLSKETEINSQQRLTMTQGKMVQSMTIMLRVSTDEDHLIL